MGLFSGQPELPAWLSPILTGFKQDCRKGTEKFVASIAEGILAAIPPGETALMVFAQAAGLNKEAVVFTESRLIAFFGKKYAKAIAYADVAQVEFGDPPFLGLTVYTHQALNDYEPGDDKRWDAMAQVPAATPGQQKTAAELIRGSGVRR